MEKVVSFHFSWPPLPPGFWIWHRICLVPFNVTSQEGQGSLMAYLHCRTRIRISDSDSDSKPDGYIVLCRSFHIGSDPDPDPYTDRFPNRYCTHLRDRYPSQGQISVPIPYFSIRESESGSGPMWNICIVQESESESESKSESGNVIKP